MISIRIDVRGIKKVNMDLDKIKKLVHKGIAIGLEEASKNVADKAKELVPVKTGKTRRSINSWRKGLMGFVGSDWKVARFLEDGTKAHEIEAKRKKVLSTRDVVIGRKVYHPGIRGTKFLSRAVKSEFNRTVSIIADKVADEVERL